MSLLPCVNFPGPRQVSQMSPLLSLSCVRLFLDLTSMKGQFLLPQRPQGPKAATVTLVCVAFSHFPELVTTWELEQRWMKLSFVVQHLRCYCDHIKPGYQKLLNKVSVSNYDQRHINSCLNSKCPSHLTANLCRSEGEDVVFCHLLNKRFLSRSCRGYICRYFKLPERL